MTKFKLTLLFLFFMPIVSNAESSWVTPNAENLLVMKLTAGRVVIELAPDFAPKHVKNIKQLVKQGYFDGLKIIRSQDNYVVQWGDPETETAKLRSLGKARANIKVEFFRKLSDLEFVRIDSRDSYAKEVGFVNGFPVASDGELAWLTHCYGMLTVIFIVNTW